MDMGLKTALFDDRLLVDCWLLAIGAAFIMVSMWLYTKSLVVTLMTFVAIAFSLGVAFFVYTVVLNLPYFPFMNLLAVIVIVGIGADDAFIYMKSWNCVLADRAADAGSGPDGAERAKRDTLAKLVLKTLRHTTCSMLVTSVTTAAAFFSSALNSITAVKCFG